MIKIIFSEKEITKREFKYKSFDIDSMEDFFHSCFNTTMFGSETILFKRAHQIKDWKFLDKILKEKDVIFEAVCDDKQKVKLKKIFSKYTIEEIKEENRAEKIEQIFGIDKNSALLLDSAIQSEEELNKLEMLFLDRPFDMTLAKSMLVNRENIDIFSCVENLVKKQKSDEYLKLEPLPFIYALASIYKTITKIKILSLNSSNYSSFKSDIYPKFKDVLPHPYYVFKNIKFARKYSLKALYDISNLIIKAERDIRSGASKEVINILVDKISKI